MSIESRIGDSGWVIPTDAVTAVGRFRPGGPEGYRARPPWADNAPVRATRAEALADIDRHTHAPVAEWIGSPLLKGQHGHRQLSADRHAGSNPAGGTPASIVDYERLARESAWRRFLTEVAFSLAVWRQDAEVRSALDDPRAWFGDRLVDLLGDIERRHA